MPEKRLIGSAAGFRFRSLSTRMKIPALIFLISGIACIFASAGVLAIRRQRPHAEVPA